MLMPDPSITRDILRAALDKAAEAGDMAAFERVISAMGGLATTADQQDHPHDPTAAVVAARPPRSFTYGDEAKTAIRAVTAKRAGGNRG
jgi:hypothetical protein